MIRIMSVVMAVMAMAGIVCVWNAPAEAATITSLELADGSVDFDGRFSRKLDRLFEQPGLLIMNEYQPGPDIVSPITKGHRTFSLFTSGVNGAAAPSATINGSSIRVDLSSLFFGVSRGDSLRAWNIGGLATGLFNPQTSEFCLSWQHLFGEGAYKEKHEWSHERSHDRMATFFLQGTAIVAQAPVPLSASLMFFVIGLMLIGGLLWRKSGAALMKG
jgi:hypothetical protein